MCMWARGMRRPASTARPAFTATPSYASQEGRARRSAVATFEREPPCVRALTWTPSAEPAKMKKTELKSSPLLMTGGAGGRGRGAV